MKRFATKYGRFSDDGREYLITSPITPRPWINVISNGDYGLTLSQAGSGYSWRTHAQLNRLTRWEQDLVRDEWGKYIYLRDERGRVWSAGWKPVCASPDRYTCRHGIGYSIIESRTHGIETSLLMFVPNDEPMEVWKLSLRNRSRRKRTLSLFTYLEWGLGAAPDWHREFHRTFTETCFEPRSRALFATKRLWEVPAGRGHWNTDWGYVAFHSCSRRPSSYDSDKESFLGRGGNLRAPEAVIRGSLRKRVGKWLDPIASLQVQLSLAPGEEKEVLFTLGAADSAEQARTLSAKYSRPDAADQALRAVRERWEGLLGTVEVETPDEALNLMTNTWLKYQAISGRLWGRTAYYQTGGAIGFRDQLQDSQVFLPIDSERTKQQILLHARHQFRDGSVYHWWHPISEVGHRNQIMDNLLWLPYVINSYLQETGDTAILEERVAFVDDPVQVALYEHAVRAIDRSLDRMSVRGLPLIGGGDWNDGLSAVGLEMKGESIWLGHFLHGILADFVAIAGERGDVSRAATYRQRAARLRESINQHGWDGEWYYRATKDSGERIGSRENTEGRIFLNAQTWAIIAGVADGARAEQALDAVERYLEFKAGTVLLHPAYTKPDSAIGYLSRYAPGARENGGVYTHAATWSVIAAAKLGRRETAYRFYAKINPINRGMNPEEYAAEPYVTPGNIDGPDSAYYGRGGWTWYTGSAAWLFRVTLEWILGVRPVRNGLLVQPCIPPGWNGFTVRRMFRGSRYRIRVVHPRGAGSGYRDATVDGVTFPLPPEGEPLVLPCFTPGTEHDITITLGTTQ